MTITTPTFPAETGLPEPGRGSHWRWATPTRTLRRRRPPPGRVLAVTRAIARRRHGLAS